MSRREFITLLGGAAAAWPLAARAQQSERMRRIGLLLPAAADDPEWQVRVGAFQQALALLGWTIGRTRARHHPRWRRFERGAVAAGDPHRADRVRARRRSGRRRRRRQLGAAGRQRHRFHGMGIQHSREMAGAAQGRLRRA
jgi:hypothetical protein